ncbi:MAG: lipo-like protein [Alphaproteobacteria bacterium]|nr:MAG: lipo-like protein [Alphaproteobacteria bacterium]
MKAVLDRIIEKLARGLALYLQKEWPGYRPVSIASAQKLRDCLRPGDILLVEGDRRVSVAIKYLTQSTWSHAALYVGSAAPANADPADPACLIEADMVDGVIAAPLSRYAGFNLRICRPVNLTEDDCAKVVAYAVSRIGMQYDLKNAIDLVRYLLPQPPVPVRWRRKMLAFGGGEPTRAICSTLIAGAFEAIQYPILPDAAWRDGLGREGEAALREIRHIKGSRLYAPRDFDLSPYFQIIKPALEAGFDYRQAEWVHNVSEVAAE